MTAAPAIRIRTEERDGMFLTAAFMITALPYLFGLGFYSDDYAFLGMMSLAENQSYAGVLDRLMESPNLSPRPVQPAYLAALYKAFGATPLPGHIFNHLFLLLGGLFFYCGLRVMRAPRVFCVALPLIYLTMPHYATDRFWLAAYNITLSMTFYFAAFYCSAQCARGPLARTWPWLLGFAVFATLSFLSYEIFLFLLLMTPILTALPMLMRQQRDPDTRTRRLPLAAQILAIISVVATGVAFKFSMLDGHRIWEGDFAEWRRAMIWLYRGTIKTGLWHHGVKLPVNIVSLLQMHARIEAIAAALAVFALTVAWLWPLSRRRDWHPSYGTAAATALLGILIYFGSYIVFANNFQISFSPTGLANRVLIGPAAGLALTALALTVICDRLFKKGLRGAVLPLLVALGCGAGTLINVTLGLMWTEAARAQEPIIGEIRNAFPGPKKGTQILIDRICPFIGPAPVFESAWDFKGVLQLYYGDPTLRADIIKPNIRVEPDHIITTIYDVLKVRYPYDRLVIYNMVEKKAWPIPDYEAAQAYFLQHDPANANGCEFTDGGGTDVY